MDSSVKLELLNKYFERENSEEMKEMRLSEQVLASIREKDIA